MNKKTMVATGLILTLLGSNIIMGEKYVLDKNIFEKKINAKSEIIETKNGDIELLTDVLGQSVIHNVNLEKKIVNLNRQIDKVEKENSSLKKENAQIKKKIEKREEVKKVFEVTAYTAGYESTQKRKGEDGYGVTASGRTVKEGRTIACPKSMKFGTKVNIEGIGIRMCEDRGGAISSGHIDLYMESVSEALKFGRRKLLVEILKG